MTRVEGDRGTTDAVFTVRIPFASALAVTVHFATADGTATTAGNDYQATSGDLRTVAFVQRAQGLPVVGGSIGFAFKADHLMLVSSTALPNVHARMPGGALPAATIETSVANRSPPYIVTASPLTSPISSSPSERP